MGETKIAILDDYQDAALNHADWESLSSHVVVHNSYYRTREELVQALAGAEVVVAMRERTRFPEDVLRQLKSLRMIVGTGPQTAAIDIEAARRLGILVTSTGYNPHPPVEHTWALILAAARNLPQEIDAVRKGGWQVSVGEDLHGRTLGVLGLGGIGSQVAGVGKAFGMNVISWSQNLAADDAAQRGARLVSKKDLFTQSDILTIHLKLSDRTQHLVGADEFALMKPSATLVNTSRGAVVDEGALVDALERGRIRGAALDVFDTEPLPDDHPLRSLPNALVTPHIGYVSTDQYGLFYRDAVSNIAAYLAGKPIRVVE
ncbi:D-2-hydroxyacid dehydrogenase family protein [Streptomyces sp. NPDC054775]